MKIRSLFLVLIITICMLIGTYFAHAADVKLDWDASEGATGYKIAMSLDLGVTWLTPLDMKMVKPYTYTGVPEDKLVLFKIAAYNANSESWGHYRFAGCDYRKKPITEPSGPGVK
jgi:hypothetical protein